MIKIIFMLIVIDGYQAVYEVPSMDKCLEAQKELVDEGIKADCQEVYFFANEA